MRLGFVFVCLGMLTLLTLTSHAQPSRSGNRSRARFSRDTLFRLLEMPAVRKEISLGPLQIKMLRDLQSDLSEQRRAAFSGPQQIPRADPRRGEAGQPRDRGEAMRAAIEKVHTQGELLVGVILDSKQMKRLRELRLQEEGARALFRQELREQLDLTQNQFDQIQKLRGTEADSSLSRDRRQQKLDARVLALLSPEQKSKFKELQGEAFEFPLRLPADLRSLRGGSTESNRSRRPAGE